MLRAAEKTAPAPAVGDLMADRFTLNRDHELSLFPGAHETLDHLKRLGVRLALITNGAAEPQRAKVIRFALAERFDHVQIEGEHGFGKPEERAYTHAMDALGVGPRETWMVGDNLEWEIVAPQRLGIMQSGTTATPRAFRLTARFGPTGSSARFPNFSPDRGRYNAAIACTSIRNGSCTSLSTINKVLGG
jgi:HAD superfamily hydrolase (TIGR01509 family)